MRRPAPREQERGAVAIMVAVLAVSLFVVAALVVDLGLARDVKRQSQNAADASALAAANVLYPDSGVCAAPVGGSAPCLADAANAAMSYSIVNYGTTAADWAACTDGAALTVPASATSCISFDNQASPTQVRVLMPTRDVDTGFGALADVDQISVAAPAQARVDSGQTIDCAMCFLGDVDSGNADYTVTGGSIAVAGDVALGAQGHMTGTAVAVGGAFDPNDGYSPKPVIDIEPFDDPLAGLALPVGNAGLAAKSTPCATAGKKGAVVPGEGPGVYGDVDISGTCALEAGLYIITGQWSLKNNDILTNNAGGVTLYFTCGTPSNVQPCSTSGQAGGQLFGKNGGIDLTARTVDPISGFAVVYDRNNNSSLQLQGNGRSYMSGGVYAKRAALEYNGNSCFTIHRGPIVVDGVIKANGNKSCVKVTNAESVGVVDLPGGIALSH